VENVEKGKKIPAFTPTEKRKRSKKSRKIPIFAKQIKNEA
jgi:hypothetical protein